MATFKAEVYAHQKKKDGTYNIKIRVYHNKEKKYLSTPFFVTQEHLTQRGNLKSKYYIKKCDDIINSYRHIVDELGVQSESLSCEELVKRITSPYGAEFHLNFIEFWEKCIDDYKRRGRSGNAATFKQALNKFRLYFGDDIDINDITTKRLQDWIDDMGIGNGVYFYISKTRTIYNLAKYEYNNEDEGIINITRNPFKKIVMPPRQRKKDKSLILDDILRIFNYETDKENLQFAIDMFKLSFCLLGTNVVDLYNCTTIRDNRLEYERQKTKNNTLDNSFISIKIEPEIAQILSKYMDNTNIRAFKFYEMFQDSNSMTNFINRGLHYIGDRIGIKDISYYSARHSWATIAYNDCEVDKFVIHQALNHTIPAMAITDIYIRKDFTPIDKANRKVLDYVFNR